MSMDLWQQIVGGVSVAVCAALLIGAVAYVRALKGRIHDLEKKCENYASKEALEGLKLQMKDLERTDALQQQTLDKLHDLFPVLRQAVDALANQKKK